MSKENPNELKIINKNERLKYQKLLYKYKQQIAELKQHLAESESKRKILEEKVKCLFEENEECFVDGQKYNELKQQLHDLPKKIVGEIKNNCWYGGALLEDNYYKVTDKLLDTILKKFGGKDE